MRGRVAGQHRLDDPGHRLRRVPLHRGVLSQSGDQPGQLVAQRIPYTAVTEQGSHHIGDGDADRALDRHVRPQRRQHRRGVSAGDDRHRKLPGGVRQHARHVGLAEEVRQQCADDRGKRAAETGIGQQSSDGVPDEKPDLIRDGVARQHRLHDPGHRVRGEDLHIGVLCQAQDDRGQGVAQKLP